MATAPKIELPIVIIKDKTERTTVKMLVDVDSIRGKSIRPWVNDSGQIQKDRCVLCSGVSYNKDCDLVVGLSTDDLSRTLQYHEIISILAD